MHTYKEIFTQCDICGRDIRYGNAVLEIERNVEQHDYDETTDLREVTVIDSDPLITLCARCGNCLADRKDIWKHLVRTLGLPGPATNEDAAQQTEAGLPETCGCCGEELETGRARVSLVRLIGQMDWSKELNDGEMSVIDGEDILSFCPSCGNRMNADRLKRTMRDLLDDIGAPERHENRVNDDEQLYVRKGHLLDRALKHAGELDIKQGLS